MASSKEHYPSRKRLREEQERLKDEEKKNLLKKPKREKNKLMIKKEKSDHHQQLVREVTLASKLIDQSFDIKYRNDLWKYIVGGVKKKWIFPPVAEEKMPPDLMPKNLWEQYDAVQKWKTKQYGVFPAEAPKWYIGDGNQYINKFLREGEDQNASWFTPLDPKIKKQIVDLVDEMKYHLEGKYQRDWGFDEQNKVALVEDPDFPMDELVGTTKAPLIVYRGLSTLRIKKHRFFTKASEMNYLSIAEIDRLSVMFDSFQKNKLTHSQQYDSFLEDVNKEDLTFSDKGFLSTSMKYTDALNFGGDLNIQNGTCVMAILVPTGKRYLVGDQAEHELVFGRNQQLQLLYITLVNAMKATDEDEEDDDDTPKPKKKTAPEYVPMRLIVCKML